MLFRRVLDFIVGACSVVSFLAIVVMMLQIVGDVIGRYFLNSPIDGTMAIVSNWYMVAVIFLPLALVQRHRQHVVTTYFIDKLPHKIQKHMKAIGDGIMMITFAVFGYFAMEKALLCYDMGEFVEESYRIIIWPVHFFLPIGAWALSLQLILDIAEKYTADNQAAPTKE